MKIISQTEAALQGIETIHHVMDNGEQRFRLTRNTGSSYILTLSGSQSGWQNSHVHHQKKELYLLEQGRAVIALLKDRQLKLIPLKPDEPIFIEPGTAHNLYISEDTVLHTIKYGTLNQDWNPVPQLDTLLKDVDPTGAFRSVYNLDSMGDLNPADIVPSDREADSEWTADPEDTDPAYGSTKGGSRCL